MINDFGQQKILLKCFGGVSIGVEKTNTNDGRTSKHCEYRYAKKWKCQISPGNTRNIVVNYVQLVYFSNAETHYIKRNIRGRFKKYKTFRRWSISYRRKLDIICLK